MDYTDVNSSTRPSQLPLPSRFTSPGKELAEISDSQANVRTFTSKMAPPTSVKHKLVATYNEPEPKRKTLAQRAGEPNSIAAVSVGSRPTVKGTTLVGAAKASNIRNPSLTSSMSSRHPSTLSRHTSNSSFSSSVGPGLRPKSAYGSRPQTSLAFNKSTLGRPISKSGSRPATSMAHHYDEEEDEDMPTQGRRKGTQPFNTLPSSFQSSQEYSTLPVQKSRGRQSACAPQTLLSTMRDVSVSTAMSKLRIDDGAQKFQLNGHQAMSNKVKLLSTPGSSQKASISTRIRNSRIGSTESALVLFQASRDSSVAPKTPSYIPVLSKSETMTNTPATPLRTSKACPSTNNFLTKSSNIPGLTDWDVDNRLEEMDSICMKIKDHISGSNIEREHFEEALGIFKSRIAELETLRSQLLAKNETLESDLEASRQRTDALQERLLNKTTEFDDQFRAHRHELDECRRAYRDETDQLRRELTDGADRLSRVHRDEVRELERRATVDVEDRLRELERKHDAKLDEERGRRLREVQSLEIQIAAERQKLDLAVQKKEIENQNMREELEDVKGDLAREQTLKNEALRNLAEFKAEIQENRAQSSSTIHSLEGTISSLSARIHFLESGSKAQSDSFADMEARLQQAVKSAEESKKKLIKEETLRRILFNQVQELKGNIRVMCRVRPVFSEKAEGEVARLTFPDNESESKELEILGREERSSLGTVSRKTHSFTFDRVFGPHSQNQEVFEEISQLVQSALDGYNVCIFCYGQTGSGKTHTMSSEDGMIPRATHQIYETATSLKEKGWEYAMEGSFIEVYNEEIHDLLGSSKDFDKKKHEIKHDEQRKQTVVTGLRSAALDSPDTVESILRHAAANRSVAATKSNERSSRSHSVFILKLVGQNRITGETSEGTLNLVDLAGSERLKQSGAEGDRMKETQSINKSLSCLGDVIAALGQGREGAHIPYRNSKLTYLLQYSLGGNSKTLMFVMASPLEEHLSETLTSLKFATKVHNTHIGTAKKTTKMRDRGDA